MSKLFQPTYKDGNGMPTSFPVFGVEYFFAGLFALFFAFIAMGGWADGARHMAGLIPWTVLAIALFLTGVFCWYRFMFDKLGSKPFWGIIIGAAIFFAWMTINTYVNFK